MVLKDIRLALTKVSEDVTNLGLHIKNVVKYLAVAISVALAVAIAALLRV